MLYLIKLRSGAFWRLHHISMIQEVEGKGVLGILKKKLKEFCEKLEVSPTTNRRSLRKTFQKTLKWSMFFTFLPESNSICNVCFYRNPPPKRSPRRRRSKRRLRTSSLPRTRKPPRPQSNRFGHSLSFYLDDKL